MYQDLYFTIPFLLLQSFCMLHYLWQKKASRGFLHRSPHAVLFAVFLVVLGAAGIYFVLDSSKAQLFLLSLSLSLGLFASFLHPVAALSFLITHVIVRIWEYYPDQAVLSIIPKTLAAICLFVWAANKAIYKEYSLRLGASAVLFFVFLVWLFISAIGSGSYDLGVTAIKDYYTAVVVIFLLLLNSLKDEQDLKLCLRSICLAVAAVLLAATFATFFSGRPSSAQIAGVEGALRLEGLGQMGNSNDLGALIAFALPFIWNYFIATGNAWVYRWLGVALYFLYIPALYFLQSRATFLAVGAALAVGLWLNIKNIFLRIILFAVSLLIPLYLITSIVRDSADLDESKSARINMVYTGLRMAKENPLFGIGIDNFPKLYEHYTYDFSLSGEKTAHSSWVLVLAEAGPFGFLLFVLFCWTGLWKPAVQLRQYKSSYFMAVVGYGIAMSFLSHTYLLYPYLLAGILLAGRRILINNNAHS